MNDCLWNWTCACDEKCSCEKYIGVNSDKGLALAKVYDAFNNECWDCGNYLDEGVVPLYRPNCGRKL